MCSVHSQTSVFESGNWRRDKEKCPDRVDIISFEIRHRLVGCCDSAPSLARVFDPSPLQNCSVREYVFAQTKKLQSVAREIGHKKMGRDIWSLGGRVVLHAPYSLGTLPHICRRCRKQQHLCLVCAPWPTRHRIVVGILVSL
jgi:hypothetical protein